MLCSQKCQLKQNCFHDFIAFLALEHNIEHGRMWQGHTLTVKETFGWNQGKQANISFPRNGKEILGGFSI